MIKLSKSFQVDWMPDVVTISIQMELAFLEQAQLMQYVKPILFYSSFIVNPVLKTLKYVNYVVFKMFSRQRVVVSL